MVARQPRYGMEEYVRRGQAIYESRVRSLVEAGNPGRIVAIDIDSDEFELGESTLEASMKLLARVPEAQIWCVRIGQDFVHRFGSHFSGVRR